MTAEIYLQTQCILDAHITEVLGKADAMSRAVLLTLTEEVNEEESSPSWEGF